MNGTLLSEIPVEPIVVRRDHALALITEIEHMEMEKGPTSVSPWRSAPKRPEGGGDQEISGNTGKDLELHAGSR